MSEERRQETKRMQRRRKKVKKLITIAIVAALLLIGIIVAIVVNAKKKAVDTTVEPVVVETVEEETPTAFLDNTFSESKKIWTTDQLKLREQPSTDAEIVEMISRRTELAATREYQETELDLRWYEVTYGEKTGFVCADYVTEEEPKGNGYIVCIDPGHQRKGDSTQEPNGPNSSSMKARVTGGTHGTTTGVYEYELTLAVSLKLRDELENRGYTVVMTRETHDVNISNMERAQYATNQGADISVRIHANGADASSTNGALALAPSASNPYVSNLASSSQKLSSAVLNAYCTATGMKNLGVQKSDTMTGINWCTVPVTIIELGFMTNPSDDSNMENADYQAKMVQGIADGIDEYFGL